jgi:hypothetical protein
MQTLDVVNGLFEAGGGLAIWFNVSRILRDKRVRGVSPIATTFFTSWGLWNLFFFPNMGLWFSFAGGAVLVAGNLVWIALMWGYRNT